MRMLLVLSLLLLFFVRDAAAEIASSASPLQSPRWRQGVNLPAEGWRELHAALACWTDPTGRWVRNPEPWRLMNRRTLRKQTGTNKTTTAVHPAVTWVWQPRADCQYPYLPWDQGAFCAALRGRSVLAVGDSMSRQFHQTLEDLAAPGVGAPCTGRGFGAGTCRGHVICGPGSGGGQRVRLLWRRSDRLRIDFRRRFELKANFGEEQWVAESAAFRIIVLNRGAHFEADGLLLRQLRTTLAYLTADRRDALVLVRTTPPGHPRCAGVHAPLKRYDPPLSLPFHWGEFERQNAAVRAMLAAEYPGVLLLDVAPSTAMRADSHLLGSRGRDCLHYKIPGPLDEWARLLFNALHLADTLEAQHRAGGVARMP